MSPLIETIKKGLKDSKVQILLIIIGIIVLIPIIIYAINFRNAAISNKSDDWGSYMTFVSGFAAMLLSSLSTILIYLTYRSAIENSKETATLASESIKNARLQQFENSFFNLVNHQSIIIENIKLGQSKGIDAVNFLRGHIHDSTESIGFNIDNSQNRFFNYNPSIHDKSFYDKSIMLTTSFYPEFSQYIKSTTQIFEFIDKAELIEQDKYISIYESYKSNAELYLLFFFGFSDFENGLNFYLEKYQFLNSMIIDTPILALNKKHYYPKTNFINVNDRVENILDKAGLI